jgi:hypothetical protein
MKKTYLSLAVLAFCFAVSGLAKAQTLTLTIKKLTKLDIQMDLDSKQVGLESIFEPSTFTFQVKSSVENAKVVIESAEIDHKKIELSDLGKTYQFKNDVLDNPAFTLPKNFTISVSAADGTPIKSFTFHHVNAGPTAAPSDAGYKAGSVIRDALYLSAHSDKTALDILAFYAPGKTSAGDIQTDLIKNFFLKETVQRIVTKSTGQSGGLLGTIVTAAGNADVTNFADGFAKFIVKRVKMELSIAFFQKFKNELQKYPDLQTVFPHTAIILNTIDEDIYNYSTYIENLREAFRSDLQVIDQNLPGIIDNHRAFFKEKTHFELGVALRTGCYVAGALKNDMHPGDILDAYPTDYFDDMPEEDKVTLMAVKGSIQFMQLMSESLKEYDSTKHNYWVGIDMIRKLAGDQSSLKIYVGLVLQQASNNYAKIAYTPGANLYDLLNTQANADSFTTYYSAYKNYILNLGNKVNELTKMINEYKKPASDSEKVEQYAKYFSVTNQLVGYSVEIGNLPYFRNVPALHKLAERSPKYFNIATETTDLAIAVNRRKYADVINHLVAVYNEITAKPAHGDVPKELTKNQKAAIADEVIKQSIANPNATVASVVSATPAVQNVTKNSSAAVPDAGKIAALMAKYGALMSNMVNAKSSEDVANAIEDAALPTGSARVKRETISNVALNAYCGLFTGHEKITGVKDDQAFNSYGVTAPIGVSASLGTKSGFSHSLFLSLIDLGTVAAFRFTDNTTAQVPSIQLKDIFSPGIFYSLGIPKSPLSVNLGVQVGPNLRKVTKDNNDYSGKTYVRYSLSFCVDIPVLNFYTKPR